MKKLIVTLLFLLFIGCELTSSDTSIKVKTNYAGNYVVIMDNYGDTLKTLISNTNDMVLNSNVTTSNDTPPLISNTGDNEKSKTIKKNKNNTDW